MPDEDDKEKFLKFFGITALQGDNVRTDLINDHMISQINAMKDPIATDRVFDSKTIADIKSCAKGAYDKGVERKEIIPARNSRDKQNREVV